MTHSSVMMNNLVLKMTFVGAAAAWTGAPARIGYHWRWAFPTRWKRRSAFVRWFDCSTLSCKHGARHKTMPKLFWGFCWFRSLADSLSRTAADLGRRTAENSAAVHSQFRSEEFKFQFGVNVLVPVWPAAAKISRKEAFIPIKSVSEHDRLTRCRLTARESSGCLIDTEPLW